MLSLPRLFHLLVLYLLSRLTEAFFERIVPLEGEIVEGEKRGPEEEEGGGENEGEGTVRGWEGRCWNLNERHA